MANSRKSNSEVLMPDESIVTIGERAYNVKPLTLRSTTKLLAVVSDELGKVSNDPAFRSVFNQDLDGMSVTEMAPLFLRALSRIPDTLPRFLAVILGSDPDDEDEVGYIDEHTGINQALKIFKLFIEMNEPEDLIENFFELRSVILTALQNAQTKQET